MEGQRREETVRLASRDGTQLRAELERLRLDDRPSPFLKALSVCAAAAATGSKWRVPRDDEPRITMCSLPQQEVAFGCQRVRVLDLINPERGLFTFCLADERAERRINEELRDLIHGYVLHVDSLGGAAAPYRPEDDEVLLARDPQVDEWRRAVVAQSSPGNEGYVHVFYVDHGRLQDVSPRDVRRISPDLTSPPTIAFFSCMHGLPAQLSARARDRIHELMTPGVAFDARLLRKDESDIYIMQLPELTARLQADKLI